MVTLSAAGLWTLNLAEFNTEHCMGCKHWDRTVDLQALKSCALLLVVHHDAYHILVLVGYKKLYHCTVEEWYRALRPTTGREQ